MILPENKHSVVKLIVGTPAVELDFKFPMKLQLLLPNAIYVSVPVAKSLSISPVKFKLPLTPKNDIRWFGEFNLLTLPVKFIIAPAFEL